MFSRFRPKIGLALGGGAARGLAHIGVLRALAREGIPVDFLAGTSMGAVVGGAYAASRDPEAIETSFREVLLSDGFRKTRLSFLKESKERRGGLLYSVSRLVKQGIVYGINTMRPSFLSAEEFAQSMGAVLPDVAIEDLSIPFGCVALDIRRAEEVVLRHGPLREAVAASAAIPGILPPRRIDGRVLVDGGWVDKVPVLPAFLMGADVVIAVDISADLDAAKSYERGLDVVIRANAIKDAVLTGMHRRIADVVIEPDVKHVHWADFEAATTCIEAGDRAVAEAATRIREVLKQQAWRSPFRATRGRRLAELFLQSPEARLAVP